jgi:hypothetical protein
MWISARSTRISRTSLIHRFDIFFMNDKKTIEILQRILERYSLSKEEQEAVRSAIGILAWTSLAETRLAQRGERRRAEQSNPPE